MLTLLIKPKRSDKTGAFNRFIIFSMRDWDVISELYIQCKELEWKMYLYMMNMNI